MQGGKSMEIKYVLAALLGSSFQEILHWYELRGKIGLKKHRNILNSKVYWTITVIMVLASTAGVYIFLEANIDRYVARDFLVYGFAFPVLLKKAVKAVSLVETETKLGKNKSYFEIINSYFHL